MQIVINNAVFSPKLGKKLAQIRLVVFEKKQKKTLNSDILHSEKNDVTDPKAKLL